MEIQNKAQQQNNTPTYTTTHFRNHKIGLDYSPLFLLLSRTPYNSNPTPFFHRDPEKVFLPLFLLLLLLLFFRLPPSSFNTPFTQIFLLDYMSKQSILLVVLMVSKQAKLELMSFA